MSRPSFAETSSARTSNNVPGMIAKIAVIARAAACGHAAIIPGTRFDVLADEVWAKLGRDMTSMPVRGVNPFHFQPNRLTHDILNLNIARKKSR